MKHSPFQKVLTLYLILALIALSLPSQGWAMFLPSSSFDRAADHARIRTTLETSMVKQRLVDYGLSPEDAMARLNTLSDEQLHEIAANMDSLQAGGGVVGDVVFILLVVVIVIAVLELTGHHVIVRH